MMSPVRMEVGLLIQPVLVVMVGSELHYFSADMDFFLSLLQIVVLQLLAEEC